MSTFGGNLLNKFYYLPNLFSYSCGQFIIGDGNNIYDFTYVENVAHAHICAERALASEGTVAEKAAGQVLFLFYLCCIFN